MNAESGESWPPPIAYDIRLDHIALPKQHNCDDCGVYTIKYMEMWDPGRTYDGRLTMPVWTMLEVLHMRKEVVLGWVLDDRNEHKQKTLLKAEVIPPTAEEAEKGEYGDCAEQLHERVPMEVDVGPGESSARFEPVMLKQSTGAAPTVRVSARASSIANRVKDGARKRTKGPQTRTPYTAVAKKRTRKTC